jgi:hypothetical protein
MDLFVLPFPVLTWDMVLHARDPVRSVTRGWVRGLRKRGQLSAGITVTERSPRGVSGRCTYHSSLWVWSERCRLEGLVGDADVLEASARALESRFAEPLHQYLTFHTLAELRNAAFFPDLAQSTASALSAVEGVASLVLTAGTVSELDESLGRVEGRAPSSEPTTVDLPARMLTGQGLVKGHPVWVLSRVIGAAALVEVEPALHVWLDASVGDGIPWARVPASDDILDEASVAEARAADRYELTAGAMPPSSYWLDLFADAREGRLPQRHLHPVG